MSAHGLSRVNGHKRSGFLCCSGSQHMSMTRHIRRQWQLLQAWWSHRRLSEEIKRARPERERGHVAGWFPFWKMQSFQTWAGEHWWPCLCVGGCPRHSASSGPSSLQAEACCPCVVWSFGQYLLSTCYLPVLAGVPVVWCPTGSTC